MNQTQMLQRMKAEYTEWVTTMELWRVQTDVVSYVEASSAEEALSCVHGWQATSELHVRRATTSDVPEMLNLDGWTLGDWIGA
jgi:hypothetical protein